MSLDLKAASTQALDKIFLEFIKAKSQVFLLKAKNREKVFNYFQERIESEFLSKENLYLKLMVFDIDKARSVISYLRNSFVTPHFVVLSFYSLNEQAQNTLLKVLEETPPQVKIIFIVPKGIRLLSTILSRVYTLELIEENFSLQENSEKINLESLAKVFLKTKKIERMNLLAVKELLSQKDEYALISEAKERIDRESVENFLLEIHQLLFKNFQNLLKESQLGNLENQKAIKAYLDYLEDILQALQYIKLNSSSAKFILEYLALKLPDFTQA